MELHYEHRIRKFYFGKSVKRKPFRCVLRRKNKELLNELFRKDKILIDGCEVDRNVDDLLDIDLRNAFDMVRDLNEMNGKEKLVSMNFIRNSLYKFPFDLDNQEELKVLESVLGHISPLNSFYIRKESLLFFVNLLKYNPQVIKNYSDISSTVECLCCILNEKIDLIDAALFCFTILTKPDLYQNIFQNLPGKLLNLVSSPLTYQQIILIIDLIDSLIIQPQSQSNYLTYFSILSKLLDQTDIYCQQEIFMIFYNFSNLQPSQIGIFSIIEIANICKRFIFDEKLQNLILIILNNFCAGDNDQIEAIVKFGILDILNQVCENIENDSLKIVLFMLSNIASVNEFQREILILHPIFDRVLDTLKIGSIEVKIEASYVVRNVLFDGKFEEFFKIDYKFDPGILIKDLDCNNDELCLNFLEILKVYLFYCDLRIDLKDYFIDQIEIIKTKNQNLLRVIEEIFALIKIDN